MSEEKRYPYFAALHQATAAALTTEGVRRLTSSEIVKCTLNHFPENICITALLFAQEMYICFSSHESRHVRDILTIFRVNHLPFESDKF